MPQFLENLLPGLANFLTGNSQKEDSNQQSNANDDPADGELTGTASVEEVEGSSPASNKSKRGREELEQSTRSKKKGHLGEHEKRLVPHYGAIPKDAQPIGIPARPEYDSRHDWFGPSPRHPSVSQRGQPKMGGYQHNRITPRDTLNQPSQQASKSSLPRPATSGSFSQGYPENRAAYDQALREDSRPCAPPRLASLRTEGSRGSNVRSHRTFDDFDAEQQHRGAKRQKTAPATSTQYNGSPPQSSSRETVDLTSDIEEDPEVRDNNNRRFGEPVGRVSPSAQARRSNNLALAAPEVHVPRQHDWPFDRPEQLTADGSAPRIKKKHQTGQGGIAGSKSRSTSMSKATTPESTSGWRPPGRQGTRRQLPDVDEIEDPGTGLQASSEVRLVEPRKTRAAELPPIALDVGLYEAGERQKQKNRKNDARQGSRRDLSGANDILQHATSRASHDEQASHLDSTTGQKRRIQQHDQSNGYSQSHLATAQQKEARRSTEISLNTRFVRDTGSPDPRPAKQPQRPESRTSVDSVDVLNGDTTVRNPGLYHSSPQKPVPLGTQAPRQSNWTRKRAPSDSDLHPTSFKSSKADARQAAANRVKESSPEPSGDDKDDGDLQIPIAGIFCKGVISYQKGLDLFWDEDRKVFYVRRQGEFVSAKKTSFIAIGRREAGRWIRSRGSLKVILTGSAGDFSTGHIAIQFFTEDGQTACQDCLLYASGDTLTEDIVSREELERIFAREVKNAQVWAEKKNLSAPARNIGKTQALLQTRRHIRQSDDIIYEPQEPESHPRRPRARDRMQGDTMAEAITEAGLQSPRERQESPERKSRYFNDNEQPRRSTRQSKPVRRVARTPTPPPKWSQMNKMKEWSHSVEFPFEGSRRANVDFQDIEKLDEGEFLNDNLVSFELRRIEESMAPEHREKVHFFNTFFYTALTTKSGKIGRAFNYEAVKRWTKNVDLFSTPYVVVPINEDLHWFVAIICNLPNVERKIAMSDDDKITGTVTTAQSADGQEHDAVDEHDAAQVVDSPSLEKDAAGSDVFIFDDNGTVTQDSRPTEEDGNDDGRPATADKKKRKSKGKKYEPHDPVIMTLDSFAQGRSTQLRFLKAYLSAEAKDKRGIDLDTGDIPGMTAKGLPEQPNFCDCGVYLVAYIEEFAKDPEKFVRRVLQREMDTNEDFAGFDPSAKRKKIRDTLFEMNEEQEAIRLQRKRQKAAAKKTKAISATDASSVAHRSSPIKEPPSSEPTRSPAGIPQPQLDRKHHSGVQSSPPQSSAAAVSVDDNEDDDAPPTSTAHDEDEDLEVEAPKPLPKPAHRNAARPESSPHDSGNASREEDLSEIVQSGQPSASQDVYTSPLPYNRSIAGGQGVSLTAHQGEDLLRQFEEDAGLPPPPSQNRKAAKSNRGTPKESRRAVITIDDSFDGVEQPREIPESQQTASQQRELTPRL